MLEQVLEQGQPATMMGTVKGHAATVKGQAALQINTDIALTGAAGDGTGTAGTGAGA